MLRTPAWATTWTILRLVMAAAIAAAIIAQLIASVTRSAENGQNIATVVANFFSFFTILSNAITVVVLLLLVGWHLTAGRREAVEPRGLAVALASVSTYMIITGIVYNLLLRGVQLYPGTEPIPWSNEVLHLVGPLFLLLDVFLAPRRRALAWNTVWIIAAFPIVWVIYTIIRGPLVTNPATGEQWWYPYPFLNPHNFDNGFGGVAIYIVVIAVAIIAVGSFVVWWGRRAGRRATAAS
ncbi:Pr6Pr family membrane protein [uncultured Microbacterium sp.]|uniref:Pr6Pr family membrane protein n=1 Tax=uncultured Microbacterium sp. TaxID=191216 RepID=UPI0035CC744D